MPPMYLRCSLPGIAWAIALLRGRMKTICGWQQELYRRHPCQVELESTSQAAVKTGMTNVAGPSIPGSTGGHAAGASAAYENQALFSCRLHLSCRTGNCWKQDRYNVCSNINYCYTVRYLPFSDNPKCKVLVVEQLRAMVAYENQTTRGLFQE